MILKSLWRKAIGVDHFALYDSDGSAEAILERWRSVSAEVAGHSNRLKMRCSNRLKHLIETDCNYILGVCETGGTRKLGNMDVHGSKCRNCMKLFKPMVCGIISWWSDETTSENIPFIRHTIRSLTSRFGQRLCPVSWRASVAVSIASTVWASWLRPGINDLKYAVDVIIRSGSPIFFRCVIVWWCFMMFHDPFWSFLCLAPVILLLTDATRPIACGVSEGDRTGRLFSLSKRWGNFMGSSWNFRNLH